MIELERAAVDAAILQLVRDQTFAAADFLVRANGVSQLSPQLVRVTTALVA